MSKKRTTKTRSKIKSRGCLSYVAIGIIGVVVLLTNQSDRPASTSRNETRTVQQATSTVQVEAQQLVQETKPDSAALATNTPAHTEPDTDATATWHVIYTHLTEAVQPTLPAPNSTNTSIRASSNPTTTSSSTAVPATQPPTLDANGTATRQAVSAAMTQMAEPTATIANTSTRRPPTQAPAETYYTTGGANARSCASTECGAVTTLAAGTRVEVVGYEQGQAVSGNATWRMVRHGGQVVYVHSSLLTTSAPAPAAPPPSSSGSGNNSGGGSGNAPPPAQPTSPPPASNVWPGCVDINTASFDELRRIIHIDVDRAQQIINLRPFRSVDDMVRIKGIAAVRLGEIKAEGLACAS